MTNTTKTRARPATFNLEDVNKIVGEALDRQRAEMQAAKPVTNGKSQASMANEIAVVRAFKKAGFGNVTPHVDVKTFNRWMMDGLRPVEGIAKKIRLHARQFAGGCPRAPVSEALSSAHASLSRLGKPGRV